MSHAAPVAARVLPTNTALMGLFPLKHAHAYTQSIGERSTVGEIHAEYCGFTLAPARCERHIWQRVACAWWLPRPDLIAPFPSLWSLPICATARRSTEPRSAQ